MKSGFSKSQINIAILLLRIGAGAMMLTHGYPKLLKLLSGDMKFADPLGLGPEISLVLAVFAEFLCSITLILGFYTRISAFFLSFTMFIAAFVQHIEDPFGRMEKALLYLVIFIVLMLSGAGRISVDQRLKG